MAVAEVPQQQNEITAEQLDALTPKQREAWDAVVGRGLTLGAAAIELGINEPAMVQRMMHARRRLSKLTGRIVQSNSKYTGRAATQNVLELKRLLKVVDPEPPLTEEEAGERPASRHECMDMPRPCPFVSCSHHLYLDVNPETGSIKLNFPHLEVWEMAETCSLDVADRGGATLEEVGAILNLTRERIRQVEVRGLAKIKDHTGDELGLPPER
jgi:hypothetical protein